MKTLTCAMFIALCTGGAFAQSPKPVEAYSRVYHHQDGTRTETRKDGNKMEIHELTYNKNSILKCKRIFLTDSKGRTRRGIIYDGKNNPLGSIEFGYDTNTDQLVEERQFNRKYQLLRRLFYPGALKEPRFAKRFVAFNYDPDNPKAAPVQSREQVRPTRPVQSDQDEFEPGIPIGRDVPAANAAPAADSVSAARAAPAAPRRSILPSRKP